MPPLHVSGDRLPYERQEVDIRTREGSQLRQLCKLMPNDQGRHTGVVDLTSYQDRVVRLYFLVHQGGYRIRATVRIDDRTVALT